MVGHKRVLMKNLDQFEVFKQKLRIQAEAIFPKIVSYFRLGRLVQNPELLKGGFANINYLVKTKNGYYVVKILLTEKVENLINEMIIQGQLEVKNINCPKYIKSSKGDYIIKEQGVEAVISKLIPGISNVRITNKFCFNMGKVLAEFHESVLKLDHPHQGWLNRNSINTKLGEISKGLSPLVPLLINLKDRGESVIYNCDLPRGIIHGDLYEGNVLVNPRNLDTVTAIFDFEHSEENILIIDLARTILSIAEVGMKLNDDLVKSTIDGYNSVRFLQELEIKHIPDAIKYVAGIGGLWLVSHGEINLAQKYLSKGESI